ncbi:hypothetical protein [Aeromonas phage phiWae14]|nr:hypothetical protein [Aeromonas phage phiWae14]
MGGTNDPVNLVRLTYRQHYIAHKLLTKIYPDNNKLEIAFKLMVFKNSHKYYNSRDFENARALQSTHMRNNNPMKSFETKDKMRQTMIDKYKAGWTPRVGKSHSEQAKANISAGRSGKLCGEENPNYGKQLSEETKLKISKSRIANSELYKKPRTEEVKRKISESCRNRVISDETKRKISEYKLNLPPVTCPHCNKTMKQGPGAVRWHFDNCKLSPKNR